MKMFIGHMRFHTNKLFLKGIMTRDRDFLISCGTYCAIALLISTFQFTVFTSFVRAGSVVPTFVGGDVWITTAGVKCFDFPDQVDDDYAGTLARYFPGARFRRVIFGFTTWRSPTGVRANVALVGVEGLSVTDNAFVIDRSDAARLGVDIQRQTSEEVSIGDVSLRLGHAIDGLATFLGVPYVLVPFDTGREILRGDAARSSYLVGDLPNGQSLNPELIARASRDFPEVEMQVTANFAASSARYWFEKTGAGLAILLASLLAAVLTVFIMTTNISRFIQKFSGDFLSILGHGADHKDIFLITATVSLIIGIFAMAMTSLLMPMMVGAVGGMLPWVGISFTSFAPPLVIILFSVPISVLSCRSSLRAYTPDIIFRS
jgi:hypothetical protein